MAITTVVTPGNLGNEFDMGLAETGKIHINVDGVTLKRLGAGTLVALSPPHVVIELVNKIGLMATLNSAAVGNGVLTYTWSGTGATFATPTTANTTVTFAAPGSYAVTLTISDGNGASAVAHRVIQVDRILYVNGNQEDTAFSTVQGAFDWITANDAANVTQYLLELFGDAQDTARVAPNLAQVHFNLGASLPKGVDFTTPGTYTWGGETGDISSVNGIVSSSGPAITLTTGVTLFMTKVGIRCNDVTATGLLATAGNQIMLRNCNFGGTCLWAIDVAGVPAFYMTDTFFTSAPARVVGATNTSSHIINCRFALSGVNCLVVSDFRGAISGNRCNASGATANVAAITVDAPLLGGNCVFIANNTIRLVSGGTGVAAAIKVLAGVGLGGVRIENNSVIAHGPLQIALHMVGAPPADILIANNVLEGRFAAIASTTDAAATIPLLWANAPVYNNTISGAIINVNGAAGTPLTGGNLQI